MLVRHLAESRILRPTVEEGEFERSHLAAHRFHFDPQGLLETDYELR